MAISLTENKIYGHSGDPEEIVNWEVWFLVPMKGLFRDREVAIKEADGMDLDPDMVVIPVSVAVGSEGGYEAVLK